MGVSRLWHAAPVEGMEMGSCTVRNYECHWRIGSRIAPFGMSVRM